MSDFLKTLRDLDARATPGPLAYSPRPNDRPDEAPGSIIAGAETGRAVAVAVSPRYCRGQFKNDAALLVLLRNSSARIAALVEAADRVARYYDPDDGGQGDIAGDCRALRSALSSLSSVAP